MFNRFNGANVAAGWALDGAFANKIPPGALPGTQNFSGILLATAWSIEAAVEHYWTPALRTSLYAQFTAWQAGDPKDPNSMNFLMCESAVGPVRTFAAGTPNFASGPVIGCNYNFNIWAVGTRTVWNPVKNLDVGVEVLYTEIDQYMQPANPAAGSGVLFNFGGGGGRAAGLYTPANEGVLQGLIRVQRNFWP